MVGRHPINCVPVGLVFIVIILAALRRLQRMAGHHQTDVVGAYCPVSVDAYVAMS